MPAHSLISQSRTLFVDETSRPLGRLTMAGTIRGSVGVSERSMRVLGRYAIVLLCAGHGFYSDARGLRRTVTAGEAILVFPTLPHAYGPRSLRARNSGWDELYVCFDGPVFEVWENEGLLDSSHPVFPIRDLEKSVQRLFQVLEQPRPSTMADHLVQIHEFLAVLGSLMPTHKKEISLDAPWLARSKALLESSLDRPLSAEDAARAAGLSYESFRKAFAREVGVSPTRYRTRKRIEAAQALLKRGEISHGAIARSLGFRDEAHLARRFREFVGQSPREWRRVAAQRALNRE